YSPDAGTTWLPLAPTITETEFDFDTASIVGGTDVRFRVVASTGIDTATVTSAGVRIVQATKLAVSATTLQFRNLTIGSSQTRSLAFSNTGTGNLLVR